MPEHGRAWRCPKDWCILLEGGSGGVRRGGQRVPTRPGCKDEWDGRESVHEMAAAGVRGYPGQRHVAGILVEAGHGVSEGLCEHDVERHGFFVPRQPFWISRIVGDLSRPPAETSCGHVMARSSGRDGCPSTAAPGVPRWHGSIPRHSRPSVFQTGQAPTLGRPAQCCRRARIPLNGTRARLSKPARLGTPRCPRRRGPRRCKGARRTSEVRRPEP